MEAMGHDGHGGVGPGVPDALEEDALLAILDPITWLRDATVWLVQAGMVTRAQQSFEIWQGLMYDQIQVLDQMVSDAVMASIPVPEEV